MVLGEVWAVGAMVHGIFVLVKAWLSGKHNNITSYRICRGPIIIFPLNRIVLNTSCENRQV